MSAVAKLVEIAELLDVRLEGLESTGDAVVRQVRALVKERDEARALVRGHVKLMTNTWSDRLLDAAVREMEAAVKRWGKP